MQHILSNALSKILLTLTCLIVASCASTTQLSESLESEKYWWRVKFRFVWPQDTFPDFYYHAVVADQVLRPIIDAHKAELELWRFHRRAARDKAGHQFSFIFYTDKQMADVIHHKIESDKLITAMIDNATIESIHFTGAKTANNSLLSATSDTSWPLEIQKSWPSFIMGTSQSWLDLIVQMRGDDNDIKQLALNDLLTFYQNLNSEVTTQWTQYGRHAYFHHINAVFGYQPVYIRETESLQNF